MVRTVGPARHRDSTAAIRVDARGHPAWVVHAQRTPAFRPSWVRWPGGDEKLKSLKPGAHPGRPGGGGRAAGFRFQDSGPPSSSRAFEDDSLDAAGARVGKSMRHLTRRRQGARFDECIETVRSGSRAQPGWAQDQHRPKSDVSNGANDRYAITGPGFEQPLNVLIAMRRHIDSQQKRGSACRGALV